MSINKIKYYLYSGSAILGVIAMSGIVIWKACTDPPDAVMTMGVYSTDYPEETEAAMDVWNGFVGCSFLVPGKDVVVKSDDGEPCGDAIRPEGEWGHAATSYHCTNIVITSQNDKGEIWKRSPYEILVSKPGTTHTTAHEIAHEIGHVLARPHGRGVMGKAPDPNGGNVMLRISDADVDAIRKRFCR